MLRYSHPNQTTQHCLKISCYKLWSVAVWDHKVDVFTKYKNTTSKTAQDVVGRRNHYIQTTH